MTADELRTALLADYDAVRQERIIRAALSADQFARVQAGKVFWSKQTAERSADLTEFLFLLPVSHGGSK